MIPCRRSSLRSGSHDNERRTCEIPRGADARSVAQTRCGPSSPRIVAAPAAKLPFPERIPNGVTRPAFSFFKHFFGVRHSVNWHYNANDSKPKKGDSNYTFVPPQAEDEMRPSWAFSLSLVAPALLVMLFGCGGGSSSTVVNPPPGGPPALALSAFVSDGVTDRDGSSQRRHRTPVCPRAGRTNPHHPEWRSRRRAVPRHHFQGRIGRREGTARARISPQLQLESPLLRLLHAASEPAASVGVLRVRGLQFESAPSRRFQRTHPVGGHPAFRQPQWRPARFRARRVPLHRPGRRWRRGRSAGQRTEPADAARQDPTDRRGRRLRSGEAIRDPGGQSFYSAQRLARDLGLRSTQSLALFF